MDKAQISQVLREVSLLMQLKGENPFKSRAYDVAADRIAGLEEDLGKVVAENRLQTLPGIGKALAENITELVNTGSLGVLHELKSSFPEGILTLLEIEAIGPKKAALLASELGVGNIVELEKACKDGKVRHLKGFGAKTEEKILAGIEHHQKMKGSGRRPLGDVLPAADELLKAIEKAPGVVRSSLGGSVRRFCETVGDVDFIASAPNPEPVFDVLTQHPQVASVIGRGQSKCSVRLSSGLQVDLRVLPDEDFATALHHFTGSKGHNIRLRARALDMGMSISEWGVFRGEEKLKVPTEESLYQLLKMQFVPPELREDFGEVEMAIEGRLPQDLITFEDVMGNIHCHTDWSDGNAPLGEMAAHAEKLGFRYLTITEHSQTAGYAGGLKEDLLLKQWELIDELNAKNPRFTLLKGIESDILEDGSLDYSEKLLEKADIVIGSIHQRHSLDADGMTKRVLNAFNNPYLNIWGHPTGRLIQKREPAPMHMDAIFDEAQKRGVVLEINGCPERMDLKPEHIRMALARGIKLVVSSDAHNKEDLFNNMRFAVHTARKGFARKQDVLNTLPMKEFLAGLRQSHTSKRNSTL